MRNILVTGGAGFIGFHLVRKLLLSPNDYRVSVIDDLSNFNGASLSKHVFALQTKLDPNRGCTFHKEDVRNGAAVSDIILQERIDTCIHLAARVSVPYSLENPVEVIDVNVNGTLEVLEACAKNAVKNFVFASSAAVYGNPIRLPLTEEHPSQPISPYGASKVAGEALVSSYRHSRGIQNAISLRIFNVYGSGQNPAYAGVISGFSQRLSQSQDLLIYGDGNQTRDFIHISDVVNCIILAGHGQIMHKIKETQKMHSHPYSPFPLGVFNVGTGIPTSINALAKKMIEISGSRRRALHDARRGEDIKYSYADIAKARHFMRFKAIKNLDSGLKQMIHETNLYSPH
jgi:UDP-glucose 4-epimerase